MNFDELNNYLMECNAYEEPEKAHLKYIERVFSQKSKDDFDRALEDEKKIVRITLYALIFVSNNSICDKIYHLRENLRLIAPFFAMCLTQLNA